MPENQGNFRYLHNWVIISRKTQTWDFPNLAETFSFFKQKKCKNTMTIGFITFFSIPGKPKKLMQEYTSARPKTNSVPKAHQEVWLWKNRPAFSPDPRVYIFTVASISQPILFYKVTQVGAQFCKFELRSGGNVLHDICTCCLLLPIGMSNLQNWGQFGKGCGAVLSS